MSVIGTLLKARMEVKDNEMDKLDQIGQIMREQFKSITGVKVSN
jgi:V/A-type H+-transporting ATPase subunit A